MRFTHPIFLAFIVLLVGFILLSGCTRQLNVIEDSGALNVNATATDASVFIEAGCVDTGNGALDCSAIGLEERFSCEDYMRVPDDLGGLSPRLPIIECNVLVENWTEAPEEGIVREGCLLPLYRKYIVLSGGEYKLIGSKEEFVDLFAPVDSPEEALGFAVALTSAYAAHKLSIPENYRVFVQEIRTTYVEEKDGSYNVHLFLAQPCGCGNHPYYAVDYVVTRAGDVRETASEKIYENPQFAGLCVD